MIYWSGLETYFFRNSQTFASGFNLNSQIAMSNSQVFLQLFHRFIHSTMYFCWFKCIISIWKRKRRKNTTSVKIYPWQANICRCINSRVLKQQDYLYGVHPQMVIKYRCKHIELRAQNWVNFLFLLSCQRYASRVKLKGHTLWQLSRELLISLAFKGKWLTFLSQSLKCLFSNISMKSF